MKGYLVCIIFMFNVFFLLLEISISIFCDVVIWKHNALL